VQQPNVALIQEPWAFRQAERFRRWPRHSTSLYLCTQGSVYTAGFDTTPIPALCSMDVVVILVKYRVNGEGIMVVLCSSYLPYDSAGPPPSKEMAEVFNYCRER
jgi:hypothetical protein